MGCQVENMRTKDLNACVATLPSISRRMSNIRGIQGSYAQERQYFRSGLMAPLAQQSWHIEMGTRHTSQVL